MKGSQECLSVYTHLRFLPYNIQSNTVLDFTLLIELDYSFELLVAAVLHFIYCDDIGYHFPLSTTLQQTMMIHVAQSLFMHQVTKALSLSEKMYELKSVTPRAFTKMICH